MTRGQTNFVQRGQMTSRQGMMGKSLHYDMKQELKIKPIHQRSLLSQRTSDAVPSSKTVCFFTGGTGASGMRSQGQMNAGQGGSMMGQF